MGTGSEVRNGKRSSDIQSFRDILAWQRSMELVKVVYVLTERCPREEQFGLIRQVRRAAVSVPSNIAEGHGRQGSNEFARFVSIALGSINEVETQVQLAIDLEFVSARDAGLVLALCDETRKISRSLLLSLRRNGRSTQ